MEIESEKGGAPAPVPVLYGSQTGTAQDTAGHVSRALIRHHLPSAAISMDAYQLAQLLEVPVAAFVVSTTGQGEEPDNMKGTWRFLLRKSLPSDSLAHLRFAVFGLGDSTYPKFNFVAKKLHKRLLSLGATPIAPLGLADDQHPLGVDGALAPWMDTLLDSLRPIFPHQLQQAPIPATTLLQPVARVLPASSNNDSNSISSSSSADATGAGSHERPHDQANPSRHTPARVLLKANEPMTPPDHFQDVRHVVFDVCGANLPYSPGDVLYVMPENTTEAVDAVLEWFDADPETLVQVRVSDPAVADALPSLPPQLTWRELLKEYLDISAVPKRYFFEIAAAFAQDEMQKEKLFEFTTPEGQEGRYDYVNRMRRTAIEVLHDFESTKGRIPVEYAADMFGFMQPRAFSIASSPQVHRGEIHSTVAIVQYRTLMATPRLGVYTSWLQGLQPGASMHVWTQRSSFKQPPLDKPAIFIGPGTGCAPFRSMIHERVRNNAPDTIFVFGNRNADKDFLYREEWLAFEKQGLLTLITAFSRDQDHKVYVQHRIRENAETIFSAMQRGAYILLAGSSGNMPKQVREALVDIVQEQGGLEAEEAEHAVKQLERRGRYVCETWD